MEETTDAVTLNLKDAKEGATSCAQRCDKNSTRSKETDEDVLKVVISVVIKQNEPIMNVKVLLA